MELSSPKSVARILADTKLFSFGNQALTSTDPWIPLFSSVSRERLHNFILINHDASAKNFEGICKKCRMRIFFKVKSFSDESILDVFNITQVSGKSTVEENKPTKGIEKYTFNSISSMKEIQIVFTEPYLPSSIIDSIKSRSDIAEPTCFGAFSSLKVYAFNLLDKNEARSISASKNSTFSRKVGLDNEIIRLMNLLYFDYVPELEKFVPRDLEAQGYDSRMKLAKAVDELQILASECVPKKEKNGFVNLNFDFLVLKEFDQNDYRSNTNPVENYDAEYICLGVSYDDPDQTLLMLYDAKKQLDIDNTPLYLEALERIANVRKKVLLLSKVSKENADGFWAHSTIEHAKKSLGFKPSMSSEDVQKCYEKSLEREPSRADDFKKLVKIVLDSFNCKFDHDAIFKKDHFETVDSAYSYLGVSSDLDDETVFAAYIARMSEEGDDHSKPNLAIQIIKSERQSQKLNLLIDDNNIPEPENLTENAAYSMLQIDDINASDDLIIEVFAVRVQDNPANKDIFKEALQKIADARRSEAIAHYLKTGDRNFTRKRVESVPVGLNNIGNTCYLNSLLQYFYTIKPLRDFILNIKNDDFSSIDEIKKVGGRIVQHEEIRRAIQFIKELKVLFQSLSSTGDAAISPSKDLAKLALMKFSGELIIEEKSSKFGDRCCITLDEADNHPIENEASGHLLGSSANDAGNDKVWLSAQQDASECIDNFIFQFSAAVKSSIVGENTEQWDLIKDLFCGTVVQLIQKNGENTELRMEYFNQLIVNVSREGLDLYMALDSIFSPCMVELNGMLTQKSNLLKFAPPILQIQVQRTQFDRKRGVYKSNAYLSFSNKIYLDRYFDQSDPDILEDRKISWQINEKLELLESQRSALTRCSNGALVEKLIYYMVERLHFFSKRFPDLQVSESCLEAMLESKEKLREVLENIEQQIESLITESSKLFVKHKKYEYELHSVFMHKGTAEFGHYWIYIKDFKKNCFWKFNDEHVNEVQDSEVFANLYGSTANPYMLTYVSCSILPNSMNDLSRDKNEIDYSKKWIGADGRQELIDTISYKCH